MYPFGWRSYSCQPPLRRTSDSQSQRETPDLTVGSRASSTSLAPHYQAIAQQHCRPVSRRPPVLFPQNQQPPAWMGQEIVGASLRRWLYPPRQQREGGQPHPVRPWGHSGLWPSLSSGETWITAADTHVCGAEDVGERAVCVVSFFCYFHETIFLVSHTDR